MGEEDTAPVVNVSIEGRIEATIPSQLKYIPSLVARLLEKLRPWGDPSAEADIEIALTEALTNAMCHGNRMDEQKKVTVIATIDEHQATFTIADEGDGFDPTRVDDPTRSENVLRQGGRGLWLIRHLMDEVRYNEAANEITMIRTFHRVERS